MTRKPPKEPGSQLNWRERQVLDALLEAGEASAQEVRGKLPDPPGYSAVRALLAKLERKGLAKHGEKGLRYVYRPTISKSAASRSALSRYVRVFFEGSAAKAVAGMVDLAGGQLSEEELEQIEKAVRKARGRAKTP